MLDDPRLLALLVCAREPVSNADELRLAEVCRPAPALAPPRSKLLALAPPRSKLLAPAPPRSKLLAPVVPARAPLAPPRLVSRTCCVPPPSRPRYASRPCAPEDPPRLYCCAVRWSR